MNSLKEINFENCAYHFFDDIDQYKTSWAR